MNLGVILGGLTRQMYSNLTTGIVYSDIESLHNMLNNSENSGFGLTSDCTAGLRRKIEGTVNKYINSGDASVKRGGLNQLLYVVDRHLPKIRAYYGKCSYSEATSALITCLDAQKVAMEGALRI